MGATLLDGVVVEKNAMVAAGALVIPDTRIPSGEVRSNLFYPGRNVDRILCSSMNSES